MTIPRYPTSDEIERAGLETLVVWNRYLPSPTDEQRPILERIVARYRDLAEQDPAAAVRASRRVGW